MSYLLTTVTDARRPVFADLYSARLAISSMQALERDGLASTQAYVLMPDHLHWLCRLEPRSSLSSVMQRFKSLSSRAIRRQIGVPHLDIWQRGFHDRAIRRESELLPVCRYIVANPVRAGLCRSVRDYPHWDCRWFTP